MAPRPRRKFEAPYHFPGGCDVRLLRKSKCACKLSGFSKLPGVVQPFNATRDLADIFLRLLLGDSHPSDGSNTVMKKELARRRRRAMAPTPQWSRRYRGIGQEIARQRVINVPEIVIHWRAPKCRVRE
jgi:hypothetical protein